MHTKFQFKNLRARAHLGVLGVGRRIMLVMLKKWDLRICTGVLSIRIFSIVGLLW
jgi:hypothetical protein